MSSTNRERRTLTEGVEVRADEGQPLRIVGHAAVFNSFSQDLGGFVELIRPGSFQRALREADVRALFNHKSDFVLGRQSAGTLRLVEDVRGLRYEIDLPDTEFARGLAESIRRGDITGSSFQFAVRGGGEKWRKEGDRQIRELTDLDLFDVGPVTFPAYLAADVAIRSLAEWQQSDADARRQAERKRRERRLKIAERQ